MRFLKTLIILAIFVVTCQATTKQTLHTFDTFTIRNSNDKSCYTTIGKETEDSTKVNIGKCIEGCGGYIKISKGLKAQQYSLAIYSEATCKIETEIKTKAEFICPNPSIKSIAISGTDNNVKCGTLPPSDEIDQEDDEDAVIETNPKPQTKKPKDPNEIQGLDDSTSESESESGSSSTKPKSKGHGANADEETTADSNSASSLTTIGTISTLTIASIAAILSL